MSQNFWNERARKKIHSGKVTAEDDARAKQFFKEYLSMANARGSITHLIPSAQYATPYEIDRYERELAAQS